MPNALEMTEDAHKRILCVGRTGSGKTTQIWSLPGKKFAFIFDPNSLSSLKGCDLDYELFQPDVTAMDATLKGFNKNPATGKTYVGDKPKTKREPKVYMDWGDNLNEKAEKGFFEQYQWLIFDSMTFLSKSIMDRQLFINARYGDIEDLGDYRVVGSKMADVFNSIVSLPINIYATGHVNSFQDEKTKKIEVLLNLPGRARNMIPLMFTDIWMAHTEEDSKGGVAYKIRTRPEPRGLQDIRCSIQGLNMIEDVTLSALKNELAGKQGIGKLMEKKDGLHKPQTK